MTPPTKQQETNRDKAIRGEVVRVTDERLQEMQEQARRMVGEGYIAFHWHWSAVVNELIALRALLGASSAPNCPWHGSVCHTDCEECLSITSSAPETSGWRPIQTAPRDGTPFIGYSKTYGVVETSWEQVDGGGHPENGPPIYWWTSPHVEFLDGPFDAPSHWMPLQVPSAEETSTPPLREPQPDDFLTCGYRRNVALLAKVWEAAVRYWDFKRELDK